MCIRDSIKSEHALGSTNYAIPNEPRGCKVLHNELYLPFHKEWEYLMPVYNKCMKSKQLRGDDEYRTLLIDAVIAADRKQLHKAVVEFIKWYNENK